MERRAIIHKLNQNTYCIDDAGDSLSYVVLGSAKAAVIDTANGWEDLQQVVREITDLPLVVINTHGHIDHVFGNVFFEEAYIHPADVEVHDQHFAAKKVRPIPEATLAKATKKDISRYYNAKPCKLLPILPGEMVDLGDVQLEVIGIPGHTKGSIALLNKADGYLFSGDAINKGQFWMQLQESIPLEQYVETLDSLAPYRPYIKELHGGHSVTAFEPEFIDVMRAGIVEIIEQGGEGDGKTPWILGIADSHVISDGTLVLYDKNKLR